MGALYLAVTGERGLERLSVIKTVLPHLADKEYVSRFRDEAKVVVRLSHGNLIPVFDAGQVEGELFLAMDFVEGKDLRAVWNRCAKKQVAFPVDVAVYIVKELCRGLDYAHSFQDLELVHRDVSPPNVIVSYGGEIKLTDFGLASSTLKLEKTAPGIIYGKVAYMSPEQARGEDLDGRSDLYAAGIILWELLTGRQLFPPSKEQPQDLIKRARDPQIDAPSKRAPRVPQELDRIVLKALAPRREDRYASGEEMREALAGWLAKEAPSTDQVRVGKFVSELFEDDIGADRARRERLIDKTRERVRTLPPSDELRRIMEAAGVDLGPTAGPTRGTMPMGVGRRASDNGNDGPGDRRRRNGRRAVDSRSGKAPGVDTAKGVVVDVPRAGADGRTVVRGDTGSGAAAAAEPSLLDIDPAAESHSFVGEVIDNRYKVLDMIGEGGMGRVYLAEHIEIGKRVAIKILHPVYGRMPELVERFRREARAASRIGHPHIVDVTDSGTTGDGSVYFVMEYLEGRELAEVIDREGALNVKRALEVSAQICRALSAAHAVGIIHRDLKPENVFLTVREGTSDFVKVLDFGIAKSAEAEEARSQRLTHPGMAMGTPEYMAPEQAAGHPADARTDVYAVGAILYEMVTGQPPYRGDNFMEILTKKATIDPVPAVELRKDLPDAVNELILRAMARQPDGRPPSMEALEYEVTKCLQGRSAAVAKILGVRMTGDDRGPRGLTVKPRDLSVQRAEHEARERARSAPLGGSLDDGPGTLTAELPPVITDSVRPRSNAAWWLILTAVMAGLGVLVYVAMTERAARDAGADVGPPPRPEPVAVAAPGAPDAGAAAPRVKPPDAALRPPAVAVAPDPDKDRKDPPSAARHDGPPRTKREAAKLIEDARGFEAQVQWNKARANYERVAKGKHLRAQGLLGLAKVAFETKDIDAAIEYGRKSLAAGGGDAARMMLGHAYFKKGAYEKAIEYYEAILEHNPSNKEAQSSIAEARRKLGK